MTRNQNVSVQLSEQELLDCNLSGMDCVTGGWPTDAYNYVVNNSLAEAVDAEYVGYTDECSRNQKKRMIKIKEVNEGECRIRSFKNIFY
jgi:xylose isomerase